MEKWRKERFVTTDEGGMGRKESRGELERR